MGGSDHIHVDHVGLQQMNKVSGNQAGHLAAAQSYINANCAKSEAFHGVLEPFRGTYDTVVTNANNGMRDAQTFSGKMANALGKAHQTYVLTDDGEKTRWETTMQRAEGVNTPRQKIDYAYKSASKPGDAVLGIHSDIKDPLTFGQDKLKDAIRKKLGQDTSSSLGDKIDKEADRRNRQAITERGKQAKEAVKDAGGSNREASDAGAASRNADRQDVADRNNLLKNTVNPIKESVDTVRDDISKVRSVVDDVKHIHETSQDLDDYYDYEHGDGNNTDELRKMLDS